MLSTFPPARTHPRSIELVQENDKFFLEHWPFKSQPHIDHFKRSDMGTFVAKCVPDGNFNKMVWACRVSTLLFLIDDELDTDLVFDTPAKFDMIPGIQQIISGAKKPDPDSYIEVVSDIIWRAIEAGCTREEFSQFSRLTQEFFNSHNLPPYETLDQFIDVRRVNSGAYFVFGFARYALECRLTDDQVNHPKVKECEDIVAHLLALGNDLFSFTKEKLTNSAETNLITMLQRFEGIPSDEAAMARVHEAISLREGQLSEACDRALADPIIGEEPMVKIWIKALPYLTSGNCWWSQHCGRYNLPGHPAPRMIIHHESVGDIIEPDPNPNTELETMINGVPIAVGDSLALNGFKSLGTAQQSWLEKAFVSVCELFGWYRS